MPSFCQDLKTSYQHLQRLTAEFTAKYSDAKESGDLREVRRLQKTLEAAKDILIDHIIVVTVPDAKNLYYDALLEAGLDPAKTQEQQEMTIDIRKEIQRQLEVYREAKDDAGNPCLTEWVKDITENQGLIYAEVAQDRAKIIERIKAGMIPVVMPGRSIQIRTWEAALLHLRPTRVEDSTEKTLGKKNRLYDGYKTDPSNKTTEEGFFKHIPERPYLVWVKPTQKPDPDTLSKSFDDQQVYYKSLIANNPSLYDSTDLIPTEYIALQAMATRRIRDKFKELAGAASEPKTISPLDYDTGTRFISAGPFLGGLVPVAYFSPNLQQMFVTSDTSGKDDDCGFRPASRT